MKLYLNFLIFFIFLFLEIQGLTAQYSKSLNIAGFVTVVEYCRKLNKRGTKLFSSPSRKCLHKDKTMFRDWFVS